MSFIIELVGFLAPIVLAISYIPQIFHLHKTKDARGISLSFWLILDISLILLFILAVDVAITTGNYSLFVAQVINIILVFIVTGQVIQSKRRRK